MNNFCSISWITLYANKQVEIKPYAYLLHFWKYYFSNYMLISEYSLHLFVQSDVHISKLMNHSLFPRPLPDFSPQLRDKLWEWPGDEAIDQSQWFFFLNLVSTNTSKTTSNYLAATVMVAEL